MMESSQAAPAADDRLWLDRPAFVSTHRAQAVCARELVALADDVAAGVAALHTQGATEKPVVRRSPGRTIVQVGDVALTLAWLQSTLGTVADGELLVVVWHGSVAPRAGLAPERVQARRATTASPLWEDVLTASAESEESWRWRSAASDGAEHSSAALAAQCVERLHRAYQEQRTDD